LLAQWGVKVGGEVNLIPASLRCCFRFAFFDPRKATPQTTHQELAVARAEPSARATANSINELPF
jgi:hypothetical protein